MGGKQDQGKTKPLDCARAQPTFKFSARPETFSGTTTLQPAGLAEAFPYSLSLCSAFALPIESANATSLRLDLFVTRTSSIHSARALPRLPSGLSQQTRNLFTTEPL